MIYGFPIKQSSRSIMVQTLNLKTSQEDKYNLVIAYNTNIPLKFSRNALWEASIPRYQHQEWNYISFIL